MDNKSMTDEEYIDDWAAFLYRETYWNYGPAGRRTQRTNGPDLFKADSNTKSRYRRLAKAVYERLIQ